MINKIFFSLKKKGSLPMAKISTWPSKLLVIGSDKNSTLNSTFDKFNFEVNFEV